MPATTWQARVHVFNYFTCLLDRGGSLNGWIDCFEKTSIKGTVLCGGVSDGGAISDNSKLKEAYNMGSHV